MKEGVMVVGVMTGRKAMSHPVVLAHEYGWGFLWKVIAASFSRRRVTFLQLVSEVA